MARVGLGYDSHRFETGRPLVLGGVQIESDRGLAGHSDADVVLHAITDAILGALATGDIGDHFPSDDPTYQHADSSIFVDAAVKLAADKGCCFGNCDVTVLAEAPNLTPHKDAMRTRIAELLAIDAADVSVKAKTNEHMGFVGRGEGIACVAVVLLERDTSARH